MKIGTITIHLPANYGNALQMLSLQRYIMQLGYDTEVLSHWCKKDQEEIFFWHLYWRKSILNKISFLTACTAFAFKFSAFRRESRLRKWLQTNICWSAAVGWEGNFPVDRLDVKKVIVGSDQVWNSNCKFVKFFMLPDFPESMVKIAYAASFNSAAFPENDIDFYAKALKRFHRISVREPSSISLIEKKFHLAPSLVCDPSLLHSKNEWTRMLKLGKPAKTSYNMCYIVSPGGQNYYNDLIRIAKKTKKKLHVFAYDCTEITIHGNNILHLALKMIFARIRLFLSGVRLHLSADPSQFVQCMANCDTLFTDSFHGLIFATIFEKKCNVIIGHHHDRQDMKAKLVDFIDNYGDKSILSERFDPDAAKPISISPQLRTLIDNSKKWLAEALA